MAAPSSYEAVLPQQIGPQVFIAPPTHPTSQAEIIAALRTITAIDGLTEDEYRWLATHGNFEHESGAEGVADVTRVYAKQQRKARFVVSAK